MTERIQFVDIETTGLDPERHPLFEIAVVEENGGPPVSFFLKMHKIEMGYADSGALRLNRYHERCMEERDVWDPKHPVLTGSRWVELGQRHDLAMWLGVNLSGVLAGNAVHFDALRIERFMRANGAAPAWNYHLLDVETYAAGKLGLQPPWKGKTISEALGVAVPEGQHSAATDAQWSRDMYVAASTAAVKAS